MVINIPLLRKIFAAGSSKKHSIFFCRPVIEWRDLILKTICAGLGKTGTKSITKALRHLGFLCFSGTNQKPERRQPFETGLVRHCPQGLFSPFFTFLRATFFRPFRLSLAPFICPWVSEDGVETAVWFLGLRGSNSCLPAWKRRSRWSSFVWDKIW